MKHWIIRTGGLLLSLWLFTTLTLPVQALKKEELSAVTAVLIDAETGQVLFDKDMRTRREPASMTKVLTGMLTLENCDPEQTVTVSETAVKIPRNSSHIALTPGEELTVDEAMYALMLPSANDAANALAEHIADTQESFAQMMNQRAKELGALQSNFTNAHGLPDPNHYTTAYDMALITKAAIRTPGFLTYYGTKRYTIPPTNKQKIQRNLSNQDFMLLPEMWVYSPDVLGGKVGYTQEARHTMTSTASRDGHSLIAVVMGCGTDEKFYDTQSLFDYGFGLQAVTLQIPENPPVPVLNNSEKVAEAFFSYPEKSVTVFLPEGVSENELVLRFRLPDFIPEGETPSGIAIVELLNGDMMLEIPLTAKVNPVSQPVSKTKPEKPAFPGWAWAIFAMALVVALFLTRLLLIRRRRAVSRQRRERAMQMRQRSGRNPSR